VADYSYFWAMPTISKRGRAMPASPIRKLVPFAEQAKIRGKHVYHLNIGQPDIETPPAMMKAVREMDIKVVEYSHSAGFESYRRKLVDYYAGVGISLNHHQIMITTGGSEAILFGMFSCLDPGDEVIIPEPLYANYNGFAEAGNIVVKPITSSIDNGYALPPIDAFRAQITPKTRAILICNPNNPTGYLYSREELMQLREIVLEHDLYLFADEVYREFVYDGATHFSVLNLEGLDNNVVLMDSISKRYSACGARVGALVTRNAEVMETALKFAQARLSPPTIEQILAEAFTDVSDDYFEKVNKEYVSRRDLCVERLNNMPGVTCPNPGGAFYAMAELPVDDTDKFCQWLLEEFSLNDETVMLAPASGFYSTVGLGTKEVRIAYVLNKDDLNKAMDCLEAALKQYPGRVENEVTATAAG
jgi:aspartate aminotransferase